MMEKKLTRRLFLSGALVSGASVVVIACSAASTPAPTQPPSAQPTAATAAQPTAATAAQPTATTAAQPTAATAVQPTATTAAQPTKAAAPAAATQKVTINWWMASKGDDLIAFGIAPRAYVAKHPEIDLQINSIDDLSKVQVAIAAGDPPDLVQSWDRFSASGIYYNGGIQALDDYIKADKNFDIKQLNPISVAGCQTFDGKQWALPDQDYVISDLFYNTKMFQDKGLDPTKPPATLDDLVRIGEMFDVKQGNAYTAVGFHPSAFVDSQTYGFAFGGKYWDPTTSKITPNDPGVMEGLNWLLGRYQKYGVDNLRRLLSGYGQYQSAQNPFLAGKVAMTGFWDAMPAYRNRYAPSVQYDMSWFPYAANHPEAKGFGSMGFNPTWIPKAGKNKDMAWALLSFNSMDLETISQTSIALANTPHNLKAIDIPGSSQADPMLKKCWNYAAQGKMSYFPPTIPGGAQYSQEWSNQIDLILSGKTSIKDGMQKVIAAVQPVVDKGLKGG